MATESTGSLKQAIRSLTARLTSTKYKPISEKQALTIFNSIRVMKRILKLQQEYGYSFDEISPFIEEIIAQVSQTKIHEDRFSQFM